MDWTMDASVIKGMQLSLGLEKFIESENETKFVSEYLEQVVLVQRLNNDLELIYSDPKITDPDSVGKELIELINYQEIHVGESFIYRREHSSESGG